MSKREEKELRRLEEALLEEEYTEEAPDMPEPVWQQNDDLDYDIYNTDDTDVDLEEYSDTIYRERSGSGLAVLVTMLCMGLLSVFILILLKYLGVL